MGLLHERNLHCSLHHFPLLVLFVFVPLFFLLSFPSHVKASTSSSSPVIGILTQPMPNKTTTYIAASYVKWLEAGGARSIPIPFDAPIDMVEDIFGQIDGILFPGGGSPVPESAVHLWSLLMSSYQQEKKDMIPLWGTCLGFEFLLKLGSGNSSILEGFSAKNISLSLCDVKQHRIFQNNNIYHSVQSNNITFNSHVQGISPNRFENTDLLTKHWKMTSTNTDLAGRPFVSTIEPQNPESFPIYGVQYHPEKNGFEYGTYPNTNIPYQAIDHSPAGIALSMYMSSFFVDLVRRNPSYDETNQKYTKPDKYPYAYTYPIETGFHFEQTFVIPPASSWLEH